MVLVSFNEVAFTKTKYNLLKMESGGFSQQEFLVSPVTGYNVSSKPFCKQSSADTSKDDICTKCGISFFH